MPPGAAWAALWTGGERSGASGMNCMNAIPELISVWQSFRDARARARAVDWLVEQGLVEDDAARRFTNDHPEPILP